MMHCPREGCRGGLTKARLDIYWCFECCSSWLIHGLSHTSFDEARKISDDDYMMQTFLGLKVMGVQHHKFIALPPKRR